MSKPKQSVSFSLINANAAGIDIGSKSNWVCVGEQEEQTRQFGVFTDDHHDLAKWLEFHNVKTIAMESTGIYWKPLFLILQAYGFEVLLVNATHIKNVRGKKTDISDCQWIWQLHRAGLLKGSFQPDEFTEELRTYNRHRQSLIEDAARCISRMQKALILMNIQLPVVLTDITGKSGQAIIGAILNGQRDPKSLAALADYRVKASQEEIIKALTGQWHKQQLFTLRQAWELYHFYEKQIRECDTQIDLLFKEKTKQTGQRELVYAPSKKKERSKNAPALDLGTYAYQLCDGVDLLQIDGVGYNLVMTLAAEVGFNLTKDFGSAKQFASWLSLSPNKRITGGKVLSSKSKKNKNRLAYAFRQAANAAGRQKESVLGNFFRRISYRKGRKVAITATARKMAVIVYHMIANNQGFVPQGVEEYQQKVRVQKIKYLQKEILKLGVNPTELAFT